MLYALCPQYSTIPLFLLYRRVSVSPRLRLILLSPDTSHLTPYINPQFSINFFIFAFKSEILPSALCRQALSELALSEVEWAEGLYALCFHHSNVSSLSSET
jgi:hypothetical protein